MDTFTVIEARRSIRKFKDEPVPQELIEKILKAATLAPSGKNKQPWYFYVIQESKRAEMIAAMQAGLDQMKAMGVNIGSAKFTQQVMSQAPVTIFVFNPTGQHPLVKRNDLDVFGDIVDIQSVGAAIQNLLLAAQASGLGTLWICDVFYAYNALVDWLDAEGEMIAAVSLGYPDRSPDPRPRKAVAEVTQFVS